MDNIHWICCVLSGQYYHRKIKGTKGSFKCIKELTHSNMMNLFYSLYYNFCPDLANLFLLCFIESIRMKNRNKIFYHKKSIITDYANSSATKSSWKSLFTVWWYLRFVLNRTERSSKFQYKKTFSRFMENFLSTIISLRNNSHNKQ